MTTTSPTYVDWLVQIEPRPIASQAGLEKAQRWIERLVDKPTLTRADSQILELLSMLVEQYENREHPTPKVSPTKLLAHLLVSRGMTRAKLAAETNIPRSTITEILAGRRQISLGNIRKLAEFFHLPISAFLPRDSKPQES